MDFQVPGLSYLALILIGNHDVFASAAYKGVAGKGYGVTSERSIFVSKLFLGRISTFQKVT